MFFAVVGEGRTWRNVGYLFSAFPLGLAYFILLVVGISLGVGMLVLVVGIPILAGVLFGAYGLGEMERLITNGMLGLDIPKADRLQSSGSLWENVRALFTSPDTWKRIGYLFAKFPLGIIGFTLTVMSASFFAMVATPFFYEQSWWPDFFDWPAGVWDVDTLGEAVLLALASLVISVGLLHVINVVAAAWGEVAKALLGPSPRAAVPASTPQEKSTV